MSPQKTARSPSLSPRSSPIKSPLLDDGIGTGCQSFVAKCFYGLKSSGKKDLASPPRKLEQFKPKKEEPKILRDPSLNQRLLEMIAGSPVKQAVLQSCSLEEFRKIYQDEIKEVELEAKLSNHRLTRSASKIVYRRNNSDEEDESDDDCMSFVDEEVSFKIPNRGFDIDSASDCSSIKVQSPASLKDKFLIRDRNSPSSKRCVDQDDYVDNISSNDPEKDESYKEESPSQHKLVSCTTSASGRKFFKSKSLRESLASRTRSVVVGKNFNLRFVPRSHDKESKSQKRKKSGTSFKPRRLSLEDCITAPSSVLSNQTNIEKKSVMTPNEGHNVNNDDDFLEDFVLKKDSKTYIASSQKTRNEDEDDVAEISNSLPESDWIGAGQDTKRASPTESLLSSNSGSGNLTGNVTKDKRAATDQRLFPIFTNEKSSGIKKNK